MGDYLYLPFKEDGIPVLPTPRDMSAVNPYCCKLKRDHKVKVCTTERDFFMPPMDPWRMKYFPCYQSHPVDMNLYFVPQQLPTSKTPFFDPPLTYRPVSVRRVRAICPELYTKNPTLWKKKEAVESSTPPVKKADKAVKSVAPVNKGDKDTKSATQMKKQDKDTKVATPVKEKSATPAKEKSATPAKSKSDPSIKGKSASMGDLSRSQSKLKSKDKSDTSVPYQQSIVHPMIIGDVEMRKSEKSSKTSVGKTEKDGSKKSKNMSSLPKEKPSELSVKQAQPLGPIIGPGIRRKPAESKKTVVFEAENIQKSRSVIHRGNKSSSSPGSQGSSKIELKQKGKEKTKSSATSVASTKSSTSERKKLVTDKEDKSKKNKTADKNFKDISVKQKEEKDKKKSCKGDKKSPIVEKKAQYDIAGARPGSEVESKHMKKKKDKDLKDNSTLSTGEDKSKKKPKKDDRKPSVAAMDDVRLQAIQPGLYSEAESKAIKKKKDKDIKDKSTLSTEEDKSKKKPKKGDKKQSLTVDDKSVAAMDDMGLQTIQPGLYSEAESKAIKKKKDKDLKDNSTLSAEEDKSKKKPKKGDKKQSLTVDDKSVAAMDDMGLDAIQPGFYSEEESMPVKKKKDKDLKDSSTLSAEDVKSKKKSKKSDKDKTLTADDKSTGQVDGMGADKSQPELNSEGKPTSKKKKNKTDKDVVVDSETIDGDKPKKKSKKRLSADDKSIATGDFGLDGSQPAPNSKDIKSKENKKKDKNLNKPAEDSKNQSEKDKKLEKSLKKKKNDAPDGKRGFNCRDPNCPMVKKGKNKNKKETLLKDQSVGPYNEDVGTNEFLDGPKQVNPTYTYSITPKSALSSATADWDSAPLSTTNEQDQNNIVVPDDITQISPVEQLTEETKSNIKTKSNTNVTFFDEVQTKKGTPDEIKGKKSKSDKANTSKESKDSKRKSVDNTVDEMASDSKKKLKDSKKDKKSKSKKESAGTSFPDANEWNAEGNPAPVDPSVTTESPNDTQTKTSPTQENIGQSKKSKKDKGKSIDSTDGAKTSKNKKDSKPKKDKRASVVSSTHDIDAENNPSSIEPLSVPGSAVGIETNTDLEQEKTDKSKKSKKDKRKSVESIDSTKKSKKKKESKSKKGKSGSVASIYEVDAENNLEPVELAPDGTPTKTDLKQEKTDKSKKAKKDKRKSVESIGSTKKSKKKKESKSKKGKRGSVASGVYELDAENNLVPVELAPDGTQTTTDLEQEKTDKSKKSKKGRKKSVESIGSTKKSKKKKESKSKKGKKSSVASGVYEVDNENNLVPVELAPEEDKSGKDKMSKKDKRKSMESIDSTKKSKKKKEKESKSKKGKRESVVTENNAPTELTTISDGSAPDKKSKTKKKAEKKKGKKSDSLIQTDVQSKDAGQSTSADDSQTSNQVGVPPDALEQESTFPPSTSAIKIHSSNISLRSKRSNVILKDGSSQLRVVLKTSSSGGGRYNEEFMSQLDIENADRDAFRLEKRICSNYKILHRSLKYHDYHVEITGTNEVEEFRLGRLLKQEKTSRSFGDFGTKRQNGKGEG